MNSGLKDILVFATGVLAGSYLTWKLVNRKYTLYEECTDEFISKEDEYVVEEDNKHQNSTIEENDDDDDDNNNNRNEYYSIIENNNYNAERSVGMNKPFVIPPYEFGEDEDYECVSLTYYSDGVLADEDDSIIENVEDIIGKESLNHFGEYEEDSVFVKNVDRKTYYEILKDLCTYSEVCE